MFPSYPVLTQELKLQQSRGQLRSKASSTLDDFARRSGYADMAAGAMQRVRARLMGYMDDGVRDLEAADQQEEAGRSAASSSSGSGGGTPAASRVLHSLVLECSCREERAQAIAEACVPPGLSVKNDLSGGPRVRLCTTPANLKAAIAAELQRLQQAASTSSSSAVQGGSSAGRGVLGTVLPSGELCSEVLVALEEDVREYEEHVYSRLSPLERYGAGPAGML